MSNNVPYRPVLLRGRTLFLCFLIMSVCTLSGCRVAYRTLLGVKMKMSWMGPEKLAKDFKKKGVPADRAFVLDTASYDKAVRARYKAEVLQIFPEGLQSAKDSAAVKQMRKQTADDLQPVQVRYFTADGTPIFKLVNCYLDPPIPMRWNVEGAFDEFPPRPISELKDVEDDSLAFFLKHIRHIDGSPFAVSELPKADYYAVLFINDFMVRPSRKLLKEMRKYRKRHPERDVHVLYVNNHNAQMWSMMNLEERERAKAELAEPEAATR